jgi:hypothetical protein
LSFPASLTPTYLALVIDLDLRVFSPSGATNFPWVLNPASPSAAATKGDNFRDPVEQVVVPSPTAGTYIVQVRHKGHIVNASGQNSAQSVSLLASGIQPQPMPTLVNSEMLSFSTNQLFALKWNSTPGVNYQVLQSTNLTSGSWTPASDVISATKTNAAFVIPIAASGNRFFRIIASRP